MLQGNARLKASESMDGGNDLHHLLVCSMTAYSITGLTEIFGKYVPTRPVEALLLDQKVCF